MTRINVLVGGPVSEWAPELAQPEMIDGQWVTADVVRGAYCKKA